MRKGKIETPLSRLSERSPRGSVLEKPMLINQGKLTSFPKPQYNTIEEELSHLPYKENEVQTLAKQIGIDYETEKDKYLWFLVQIVNLDLPPGWMREEDPSGVIYYHNPNENVNSSKHPMISKFRSLFNEILENEILGKAKMLALKEKVRKLEQQEKESLSPKKQPPPIKSDKIKKGNAGTFTKGTKGELVTDRGLKGVPDQPQGIVDTDRAKERFDKIKEVLEKRRTVYDERMNEVDNLVRTEEILNKCKQEYIEQYGLFHQDAPVAMTQLESFDTVDPTEIIEAARLFNIKSTQAYLFWIIRAYCGLPLLEYWSKVFDSNLHREIYYNSCHDVKISVKPCYFYILELINYVKQEAIKDKESFLHFSNKMTLCDKLGRQYDVDIASMIKDLIEKPSKERKNYFTYHQKKEQPKEEAQKVIRKKKKDEFNPNYSDAHFIEIANQIGLDLNTELHLLMVIEEFVRSREAVERWFFRQVPDGPAFWVNHEQQKAVNRYPYAKELQKIIEEARNSLKNNLEDSKKHLKTEWNLVRTLFRKHPETVARKIVLDEAKNFVEFFLKIKGDAQKNGSSFETKGYNLSNLLRKIGTQISKQDIMDLLFYCPFDFSQFLSEDFLKSTESYLLKKIHLKSVGGKAQESMNDLGDIHMHHDASFDSQGSNDSAKRIRLKIEDSKKLLDMAANIKGLNLDPEKKREFMKLLIDFDQKYGDHDLVDALEKDITENIADEAALTQNLVDTIKAKMEVDNENQKEVHLTNSIEFKKNNSILSHITNNLNDPENNPYEKTHLEGAEEIEGSSKSLLLKKRDSSRTKRVTISQTEIDNNKDNSSQRKSPDKMKQRASDVGLNDSAQSIDFGDANPEEVINASLKRLNTKKSSLKESKYNGDQQELDENQLKFNKDQDAHENDVGNEGRKALNQKEIYGNEENDDDLGKTNESENKDDPKAGKKRKENQKGNKDNFQVDPETNKLNNDEVNETHTQGQRSSGMKRVRKYGRVSDADETIIKLRGDGADASDEEYMNNSELGDEPIDGRDKKTKVPGLRISRKSEKDGKILFTNRRTQEILENLVEEQAKHSSRSQSKNRTGRAGSIKGGDEFGDVDENNIIYREIVTENGEIKLIPIGISGNNSPQKNSKIFGNNDKDNWASKNQDERLSPSNKKENKEDEALPMIIGSSYKNKIENSHNNNQQYKGKFDPQYLMDYLNRYNVNVNVIDEVISKDEKRRSDMESRNRHYTGEDSKVADATGLSNSRYLTTAQSGKLKKFKKGNEKNKYQQTYKSLEAGLQHLDRVHKNKHYEKSGKPGVWTHVEVFEIEEGAFDTINPGNYNTAFDSHKTPSVTQYIEGPGRQFVNEQTFYTPYRKGNLGARRFVEYMTYLNTVVFLRKLDTMITDFLMRQFTKIQQNNLGIDFKPEDTAFRNVFKRRYYKLIRKLRENLLKKRDFIQNVYSKIFNSPENIPNIVYQSLESLRNSPRLKKQSPTRAADKNFSLGIMASKPDQFQGFEIENKKNRTQSQSSLKLPQVVENRRNVTDKFRTSHNNLKLPATFESKNMFDDKSLRKNEVTGDKMLEYIKTENEENKNLRKNRVVLNQKELEAQKILKVINENDKENYKHYWSLLGDPLNLESSIIFSKIEIPIGIQPYHIFLMGHRLGVQIQNIEEPDLAWIAYLALLTKLPSGMETNLSLTSPKNKMRFQKLCNMKIGEHPGDKYFKTALIYNQMRRKIILEALSGNDQTSLVKAQAWTKLREDSGVIYYYNFLTKQKTQNFPVDQKEIVSKLLTISSKPEIKEKLKLINQIMTENDDLLTLFKNKFSKT